MNVKLRIKLSKWVAIIVLWLCVGVWITFYDHITLMSDIAQGPAPHYSFSFQLIFNLSSAFFAALLGGAFLVFYVEERFREKSYGFMIMTVAASFVVIIALITALSGLILVSARTIYPLSASKGMDAFMNYVLDPIHLKNVLVWAVVVSLTQFFLQVNSKFGQGVLLNFIKGKYRRPQIEERIFMFVDLKSSTTIAEALGNERYHRLLKDFFRDITNPVLYNRGQIYQYVGDEVVVSWPLKAGIEDHHCLNCYFDMRAAVQENAASYQARYGLVPEFKAGLHFGTVTAGEIGVIKRDITYSGDVLNTAARIQSKCNELGVFILASRDLTNLLGPLDKFETKSLGYISLRGKEEELELCTIE